MILCINSPSNSASRCGGSWTLPRNIAAYSSGQTCKIHHFQYKFLVFSVEIPRF